MFQDSSKNEKTIQNHAGHMKRFISLCCDTPLDRYYLSDKKKSNLTRFCLFVVMENTELTFKLKYKTQQTFGPDFQLNNLRLIHTGIRYFKFCEIIQIK